MLPKSNGAEPMARSVSTRDTRRMASALKLFGRLKSSALLVAAVSIMTMLPYSLTCGSVGWLPYGRRDNQSSSRLSGNSLPILRVGIARGEQKIELRSAGKISLKRAGRPLRVPASNEWAFEVGESLPATSSYYVCVASHNWDDRRRAFEVLKEWRRKGYRARLIKRGRKVRIGRQLVDNRTYLLAVSSHSDRLEAVRTRDRLSRTGVEGWIEQEIVRPARGTITARDANNTCVAQVSSPVSLVSGSPITVKNVNFGFWFERREDRTYEGLLRISIGKDGALQLTEVVDLETYISGVVPAEMPSSWPGAALQAQAVAARSETLAKIGVRHVADGFDLCATEHCQAYGGLGRRSPSTTAAVDATRGKVLMRGTRPLDAVYSLNCGGHTENVENVWTLFPDPALRGKLDALHGTHRLPSPIGEDEIAGWVTTKPDVLCSESSREENFRWKVTYAAAKLNDIVSATIDVGSVTDIIPVERGVSGRLKSVKIVGTREEKTVRKELTIRSVFGNLFSAAFIVEIERDESGKPLSFTFTGAGRGHGVGMCQDGVRAMAGRGADYEQILRHYYTDTRIVKLY